MNGVGERERRHVRLALIGPSLRGAGRERERQTRRGVQSFIFYQSFYTLRLYISKGKIV